MPWLWKDGIEADYRWDHLGAFFNGREVALGAHVIVVCRRWSENSRTHYFFNISVIGLFGNLGDAWLNIHRRLYKFHTLSLSSHSNQLIDA